MIIIISSRETGRKTPARGKLHILFGAGTVGIYIYIYMCSIYIYIYMQYIYIYIYTYTVYSFIYLFLLKTGRAEMSAWQVWDPRLKVGQANIIYIHKRN